MKKHYRHLLIISLLFCYGVSFGQTITITANPWKLDPTVDDGVITVYNTVTNNTTIYLIIPSTNVGNVQVNTEGTTMTNSPTYPPGEKHIIPLDVKSVWYIKFSNALDEAWVTSIN